MGWLLSLKFILQVVSYGKGRLHFKKKQQKTQLQILVRSHEPCKRVVPRTYESVASAATNILFHSQFYSWRHEHNILTRRERGPASPRSTPLFFVEHISGGRSACSSRDLGPHAPLGPVNGVSVQEAWNSRIPALWSQEGGQTVDYFLGESLLLLVCFRR